MTFAGKFNSLGALEAVDTLAPDTNGRVVTDDLIVWVTPLSKMFFLDKADTTTAADALTVIEATGNGVLGAGGRWKEYNFDANTLEGQTLTQVVTAAQTSVDAVTLNGQTDAQIIAAAQAGASVETQDDGVQVTASATTLNFTGSGVTVTDSGSGVSQIDISGGGGGGGSAPSIVTADPIATSRVPLAVGEVVVYNLVADTSLNGFGSGGAGDDAGSVYELSLRATYIANSTTAGDYTILNSSPIQITKTTAGTGNNFFFNGSGVERTYSSGILGITPFYVGQELFIYDQVDYFNSAVNSEELGYTRYLARDLSTWELVFDSSGLGIFT